MFIDDDYDNDREEAIQAILNSAMGKAAKSLESVINSTVEVTSPASHWVNKNNLQATLSALDLVDTCIVMRQSFRGHLRGEIIILLEHGAKYRQLGELLGYDEPMKSIHVQEMILELANIISGACISGLSEQLDIKLNFLSPSLLSTQGAIENILIGKKLQWTDALFMDVAYKVDDVGMKTHLILCMVEEDSQELYRLIDLQLEQQS